MRQGVLCVAVTALFSTSAAWRLTPPMSAREKAPSRVTENDDRTSRGVLRDRVLRVQLEVRQGEPHPDGDADPGLIVRAFAEEGKKLRALEFLIRVAEGTEIHASVRNALSRDTLVERGPSTHEAPGSSAVSETFQSDVTADGP